MYLGDHKLGGAVISATICRFSAVGTRPLTDGSCRIRIEDTHMYDTPERIHKCLNCPHERCVDCLCVPRRRKANVGQKGRPPAVDLDRLREMLVLKTPKSEIMDKLGVCESTYYRYLRMAKGTKK